RGWTAAHAYLLDLVPHVLGRELGGAGRAHGEVRADGDADVIRVLRCDRERHRRMPLRRPVVEESAVDTVALSAQQSRKTLAGVRQLLKRLMPHRIDRKIIRAQM